MLRSIDEAIAQELTIAKNRRKIFDECNKRDNYACRFCSETQTCLEYAEEHEQLAEWWEELKFLRQWKSDVMDEFCKYDCNSVEEVRRNGYNKAIDDFKKILTIEKIKEYAESDGFINLNNCSLMIFDIAEQLKVGGENEN